MEMFYKMVYKTNITPKVAEEIEGSYVEVKFFDGESLRGVFEIGNGGIYHPEWGTVGNTSFKLKSVRYIEVL